jgi:hypothetical protein
MGARITPKGFTLDFWFLWTPPKGRIGVELRHRTDVRVRYGLSVQLQYERAGAGDRRAAYGNVRMYSANEQYFCAYTSYREFRFVSTGLWKAKKTPVKYSETDIHKYLVMWITVCTTSREPRSRHFQAK